MGLIVFPALVTEGEGGELRAVFPDLSGLSVRAGAPGELLTRARERLAEVLRELEKAGDPWPEPSTPAQVRSAHPGDAATLLWVDVPVEDAPVRVTISLGERLLSRIDAAAAEHAMTRSGYLAAAAQRQITAGGSPLEPSVSRTLSEEVAAAGRRIQETLGPDSPVGRTLAELDAVALDGLRRMAGGVSEVMRARGRARDPSPSSRSGDGPERQDARAPASEPDGER